MGFADEILSDTKDLTEAKQIAQKVNRAFEQQISYNKGLVAMLKQSAPQEPPKSPPEPPAENKVLKLFNAL
jgi:hypothetical protein